MRIYEELEKLQTLLWKGDDLVDQCDLFDMQDLLADLTLRVAKEEGQVDRLVKKFPFLYRRAEA